MKKSDFKYRITYEENVGRSGTPAYDAEPSLEMLIAKYYGYHFDAETTKKYTARYIAQLIKETAKIEA